MFIAISFGTLNFCHNNVLIFGEREGGKNAFDKSLPKGDAHRELFYFSCLITVIIIASHLGWLWLISLWLYFCTFYFHFFHKIFILSQQSFHAHFFTFFSLFFFHCDFVLFYFSHSFIFILWFFLEAFLYFQNVSIDLTTSLLILFFIFVFVFWVF